MLVISPEGNLVRETADGKLGMPPPNFMGMRNQMKMFSAETPRLPQRTTKLLAAAPTEALAELSTSGKGRYDCAALYRAGPRCSSTALA